MLSYPEPTVPIVPRAAARLTTGSARAAVASYAGRLTRRRATRRGSCPGGLDGAQQPERTP